MTPQNFNTPEPAPIEERLLLRKALFFARYSKDPWRYVTQLGLKFIARGCFGAAYRLPSGRVLKLSTGERQIWGRPGDESGGYPEVGDHVVDGWPLWIAYVLAQPQRKEWMPRVHYAARCGRACGIVMDYLQGSWRPRTHQDFPVGLMEEFREWEATLPGNHNSMQDFDFNCNQIAGVLTDPWGYVNPKAEERQLVKEYFHVT